MSTENEPQENINLQTDKALFLENLDKFGLGFLISELTQEQKKIVDAVMRIGGTGTLTLQLSYKRKATNEIEIGAKVTPKIPRAGIESVQMFASDDNRIYECDPRQTNFLNGAIKMPDRQEKKVNKVGEN